MKLSTKLSLLVLLVAVAGCVTTDPLTNPEGVTPSPSSPDCKYAGEPPALSELDEADIPCLAPIHSGEKAWGLAEYRWRQPVVTYAFMEGQGSSSLRDKVELRAKKWNGIANIELKRVSDPLTADVRIAFYKTGHWSRIGKASAHPKSSQSMNLQITDQTSDKELDRVVIHEFGHALSLMHEHQHPDLDVKWNVKAVEKYYSGPPNNWNPSQIQTNIFDTYDHARTFSSGFDSHSIMMYEITEGLACNFESKSNYKISEKDKDALRIAYPPVN